jgi:hypothetical protein
VKILCRLALAGLVALALVSSPVQAGPGGCTGAPYMIPAGFETITVSNTSIGFTAASAYPTGGPAADMAVVDVESNAIRYRSDGIAPTATVGNPIAAATTFTVCGAPAIKAVRFIRQSADATLSVSYYRGN